MFLPATLVKCFLYLFFLIFTTSAQNGQIAQFLDYLCTEKSLVNPTVSLPANTCLVTSGAQGVVPQLLPSCGNATLQMYRDQSCAQPAKLDVSQFVDHNCFSSSDNIIPAVMFICGSLVDGDSGATATTTVTAASVLVPVAKGTGVATSSSSDAFSSQTATQSHGFVASATPASSGAQPSQTDAGGTGGGLGSGLSQHDQIALGIALPVGSLLVALLAWWCPKPWNRGRGEELQNDYRMLQYPGWQRA